MCNLYRMTKAPAEIARLFGALELPAPLTGNAYASDAEHVPSTLREATKLFEESALARAAARTAR